MVPYVNRKRTGCTELRVHGVSGTPAESSLGHPLVVQVAGDAKAGFYRRGWESESVSEDDDRFRREAYRWGGLTSGNAQRALWLLLLPFMLVNVAFFMDRGHEDFDYKEEKPSVIVAVRTALQQLLAFSLTVTYVLAAVAVSVDLVGWQCGDLALRASVKVSAQCTAGGGIWLSWLRYNWLDTTGRHLAVTAVVPVGLVGLLWYLGRSTWQRAERVPVPQSVSDHMPDLRTPLEDRRLWNGGRPVHRLRALHIAGALAVVAVFITAPLLKGSKQGLGALFRGTGVITFLRSLTLVLALLLLAAVVVILFLPQTSLRRRPKASDVGPQRAGIGYRLLPWFALALVAASAVLASWRESHALKQCSPACQLPWEVTWLYVLVCGQAALLLLLLISQFPFRSRPSWGRLGVSGVALLAWTVAGALAAGVVLRVAETLGAPAVHARTDGQLRLKVPVMCFWAGPAAVYVLVITVLIGGVLWFRLRVRDYMYRKVTNAYVPKKDDVREQEIARCWSRATALHGPAQRALGWFLASVACVVVASGILFVWFRDRLVTHVSWLVLIGNLTLTSLVLGLLWAGHRAYKNPAFRRTVGVLWDIGTFWPRATHPLAPPCYTERVVPDLLRRRFIW